MYGQWSEKDHNNYVERVLNSEDEKLQSYTSNWEVLLNLEEEMKRFVAFLESTSCEIEVWRDERLKK